MHERRNNPVADIDIAGVNSDRRGVIHVHELLIRVPGVDCDVEFGIQTIGRGEIEVREFERSDGEGRALGTVKDIENGGGGGD